MRKGLVK